MPAPAPGYPLAPEQLERLEPQQLLEMQAMIAQAAKRESGGAEGFVRSRRRRSAVVVRVLLVTIREEQSRQRIGMYILVTTTRRVPLPASKAGWVMLAFSAQDIGPDHVVML